MDRKRSQCLKCDGDVVVDTGHCPKCATSLKFLKKSSPLVAYDKPVPVTIPVKPLETSYVIQIISIGVRSDSVYEARMLLAPEVDMSSIKITVKGNNLRVHVCKPPNDQLANRLPEVPERSLLGDLVKKMMKHCENLLIPNDIDGEKVRAVVDNKHRMLVLTAPTMRPSKTRKKYIEKRLPAMDTLPHHCRENAITLKQNEYMNFEMVSNGVKTGLKFDKVPNFYIVDNKEYYAAEVKIEGLKVGTATLAIENMLNIKLHSSDDLLHVRNLNFLIPGDANARKVSVEIFNDTIFVRAPLKKKHM